MSDLISRQAAIDAVKKNTFRLTFAEEQNCEGHVAWSAEAVYSDVMEGALLELPSAQPEQQKGKWIAQKGGGYRCSECKHYALDERDGNFIYVSAKTKFCPYCGADMRGEQDG